MSTDLYKLHLQELQHLVSYHDDLHGFWRDNWKQINRLNILRMNPFALCRLVEVIYLYYYRYKY